VANQNKLVYATPVAATITLASLGSSASWLAGRESAEIDNTSNLYLDYQLDGQVTVGTTPTANTEIRVYVVGVMGTGNYPDVFDGTDSAETVTSAGVGSGFLKLASVMLVDATTSDRAYPFNAGSVAALFGGLCPRKFVVFVTHNTGVNLNSSAGNHFVYSTGVYSNNNG
jgi:hypothetical protein